ncbi:uncharacterized protein [Diadema setosum]|uniref:uncharacterized protein n=1 Tax=Diadema setosum TaxID=31175 RepID=UPI003B3BCCA8
MSAESSVTKTAVGLQGTGRAVTRKAKKFSESMSSPSRRKSLQLLQPVAGSQTKLVGSDGFIRLTNQSSRSPKRKLGSDGKSEPRKIFRPDAGKNFTIFEDKSSLSSSPASSPENETVEMLTRDTPTESYWKELAEERREALEDALKENEELHVENSRLKEENEKLKVMADQAEYLADVVETLIGKSSEESESTEESDQPPDVAPHTKEENLCSRDAVHRDDEKSDAGDTDNGVTDDTGCSVEEENEEEEEEEECIHNDVPSNRADETDRRDEVVDRLPNREACKVAEEEEEEDL